MWNYHLKVLYNAQRWHDFQYDYCDLMLRAHYDGSALNAKFRV